MGLYLLVVELVVIFDPDLLFCYFASTVLVVP